MSDDNEMRVTVSQTNPEGTRIRIDHSLDEHTSKVRTVEKLSTTSSTTPISRTTDWEEDDPPLLTTTSSSKSRSASSSKNPSKTSETLRNITILLSLFVVLFLAVYVLIKLTFPSRVKIHDEKLPSQRARAPGYRMTKHGSIGGGSGVNVHEMEWNPTYGWLININKEYCNPKRVHADGSGLCADAEDANKWCSIACKVNKAPELVG